MSYLKILIDYMALDNTLFKPESYPWSIIDNTYGISLMISVNKAKRYYNIK